MKNKIELGISINSICNLRCRMCNIWQGNKGADKLSLSKACEIIDDLDRFEVKGVRLSGGEPLLVPWALDLGRYISNKGYRSVITTNGSMIDSLLAQKIINSGISNINFSLDGHCAEVHDTCRNALGSFNKIFDALGYLSSQNSPIIGINTVISKMNLEEIIPLAQLVQEDKRIGHIYFMAVMQPFGSNHEREWFLKEEFRHLWPQDLKMVNSVLSRLIALKEQGYKINNSFGQLRTFISYFNEPLSFTRKLKCNLGREALEVNQLGDVYLCYDYESIGNIFDNDLFEIWNSEKANQVREKIRNCQQNCNLLVNCYFEEDV
jgi:MoaA/NifB/PqqE/SkfB family radical SAM enzyme